MAFCVPSDDTFTPKYAPTIVPITPNAPAAIETTLELSDFTQAIPKMAIKISANKPTPTATRPPIVFNASALPPPWVLFVESFTAAIALSRRSRPAAGNGSIQPHVAVAQSPPRCIGCQPGSVTTTLTGRARRGVESPNLGSRRLRHDHSGRFGKLEHRPGHPLRRGGTDHPGRRSDLGIRLLFPHGLRRTAGWVPR